KAVRVIVDEKGVAVAVIAAYSVNAAAVAEFGKPHKDLRILPLCRGAVDDLQKIPDQCTRIGNFGHTSRAYQKRLILSRQNRRRVEVRSEFRHVDRSDKIRSACSVDYAIEIIRNDVDIVFAVVIVVANGGKIPEGEDIRASPNCRTVEPRQKITARTRHRQK